MEATDIRLIDNDLYIGANGDFAIELSDNRHIEHILVSAPGHWRQWPLTGVAIHKKLKGPVSPQKKLELRQRILSQLTADRMTVQTLNINNDLTLEIDATRK